MWRLALLVLPRWGLVLPRWGLGLPGRRLRRVRRSDRRSLGGRRCRLAIPLTARPRWFPLLRPRALFRGGRLPRLDRGRAPPPVVRRARRWRHRGSGDRGRDRLGHRRRNGLRRRWRRRAVWRGGASSRARDLGGSSDQGDRGRCRPRNLRLRVRVRRRNVRGWEDQRPDASAVGRRRPRKQPCGRRMQDQEGEGDRAHDGRAGRHQRPDSYDCRLHSSSAPDRTALPRRSPPYRRYAARA